MRAQQIETTLTDGRSIVVFASNGNRKSKSGAKVMLIESGHERAGTSAKQTGVIKMIETTCFKGSISWSAKKQAELLS